MVAEALLRSGLIRNVKKAIDIPHRRWLLQKKGDTKRQGIKDLLQKCTRKYHSWHSDNADFE